MSGALTPRDPETRGKTPGVIVNFTPTGMIPTRAMTPFVPLGVAEIVEEVHRACEIGVTMIHLHARDPRTGEPAWRAEIYRDLIEGIRRFAPELVIGVSLSGRTAVDVEKRIDPLRLDGGLKPDLGSLTLSSVNFNHQASLNAPETIQRLAGEMRERGILPELEAFDTGMINYAAYLEHKGLLAPPHYFNLILGNISCAQADLLHVGVMVRDLPPRSLWSLGGIGDSQLPMNAVSIAMGGGVRVGLEDNIWLDRGRTKLAGNAELLQRVHAIATACDREIMPPGELRSLLHLERGNGCYGRRRDSGA